MKASMYFNYTSRSLIRGGQRTILAIFCIAVGVMAIVALQSVGEMINNAFTSNVRDANGGDISVTSDAVPFNQRDLPFFDQLKSDGTISAYTATSSLSGSTGVANATRQRFTIQAVDPTTFPVVTPPSFKTPSDGKLSALLTNNSVVIDQNLADQYNKKVGDSFDVHISTSGQGATTVHVKIAGIVNNAGVFAQSNDFMVMARSDYQAASSNFPVSYDTIYVSTDGNKAHTDMAVKAIQKKFYTANARTVDAALKQQQANVDLIKKFLEIAGLLALLIGGVGIVNTMQVLLSRRKIEIAMLKTAGYHRRDLYLLFGLEAGLLGLIGGVVGAMAAIGMSLLVRNVIQQLFPLAIPFLVDPIIIGGGVLIGFVTALIFGLMPIVQAANIRPLNVIREQAEGRRVGSIFLTIGLVLLLSVLFCAMAVFILNDLPLALWAVYGTFVFLALLSLFFLLIVFIVSKLPVPERYSIGYLALILGSFVISVLLCFVLPAFGGLLLLLSLLGFVIVLLPKSWKVNTKMALRNIGRQRGRTTTTLLALFVGVFTIGLILVLGQDLRDEINNALANSFTFNLIAVTRGNDTETLKSNLSSIPGISLSHTQYRSVTTAIPISVDGVPFPSLIPQKNGKPDAGPFGVNGLFYFTGSFEGYDVSNNQVPNVKVNSGNGRNLNAGDANRNPIVLSSLLIQNAPLKGHIHVGSTITYTSSDGKLMKTMKVVGFYQQNNTTFSSFNYVYATNNAVNALTPSGKGLEYFYMKVDPNNTGKALQRIGQLTPNADVLNFADLGALVNQFIGDILLILTTIASLSLLAGIIIIANAVALAMLERRRELGILKSVGYTSRSILGEVLIENGVVGGMGAILALLLVTLATS
ncbi:MAG: ABC transporter permease, partial [Chloroflexota bacterium]|nr:ABC transporter permease [Chloroflexota bacterium]